jgi:hypothetical protein
LDDNSRPLKEDVFVPVLNAEKLVANDSHADMAGETQLPDLRTSNSGSMSLILPSDNTRTDELPADNNQETVKMEIEIEALDNHSPTINDNDQPFTPATKYSKQWLTKLSDAADFAIYKGRSPLSHQPVLSNGSNI